MSFYVVEFVSSNDVSTISHSWYMGDNVAAWPALKPSKFKHCLHNHILPASKDYKLLEIRILKKTDDYQTARRYEKLAETQMTIASSDACDLDIPAYKRRKRIARRRSSSYELNSDEIGSQSRVMACSDPFDYSEITNKNAGCSSMQSTPKILRDLGNTENVEPKKPKGTFPQIYNSEIHDTMLRLNRKMDTVLSEVLNIKTIENFNAFMHRAPPSLKGTGAVYSEIPKGYRFKFPMANQNQFAQLNSDLADNECLLSVVETLSLVHRGISVQQCVRHIASYMFSRDFALQVNWTGANGKVGLLNTNISEAMINAVRCSRNYPNESIGSVIHYIQRWLQCARDRIGGRKKKRLSIDNNTELTGVTSEMNSTEYTDADSTDIT